MSGPRLPGEPKKPTPSTAEDRKTGNARALRGDLGGRGKFGRKSRSRRWADDLPARDAEAVTLEQYRRQEGRP